MLTKLKLIAAAIACFSLLGAGVYIFLTYQSQKSTIERLTRELAVRDFEIRSLKLNQLIDQDIAELKLTTLNRTLQAIQDNQKTFQVIRHNLQEKTSTLENSQRGEISTIVIESIWDGYENIQ